MRGAFNSLADDSKLQHSDGRSLPKRLPRVLFLNTRSSLGADVAVHVMLGRSLVRAGVPVWAATSTYEEPGVSARSTLESIPGLIVLPLDLGRPITGLRGYERASAYVSNAVGLGNLVRLAWACRRERVDIVHVTDRPRDTLFGLLLARLAGCACLVHLHTGYYRRDRFGAWESLVRTADGVVAVSRHTASTFLNASMVAQDRTFVVHNAVDSATFRPNRSTTDRDAVRRKLGIPSDVVLIGCVARVSRWKDQDTVIESLAAIRQKVPGARLVLAGRNCDVSPDGHGSYEDYLRRRASDLGLENAVTFAGFIPQNEMPAFYTALDVLAHAAFEEPFGLAVVEAMASGCPVVAVNGGGIPEIIRDGADGLLVPREQPAELARAVLRVLCEDVLSRDLSRSARARVCATFTPERQAHSMLMVYQLVLQRRSRHVATSPQGENGQFGDAERVTEPPGSIVAALADSLQTSRAGEHSERA